MTRPFDPLQDAFTLSGGRRAALALRAAVLAAISVAAAVAFAVAIGTPGGDGQGGAGTLVVPVLAGVASLLGLAFTLGQWWDDATHFGVRDGRLEVRHGGTRVRGRAVTFDRGRPIALDTTGGQLSLEQASVRINVGAARILGGQQIRGWESWMRSHGVALERQRSA